MHLELDPRPALRRQFPQEEQGEPESIQEQRGRYPDQVVPAVDRAPFPVLVGFVAAEEVEHLHPFLDPLDHCDAPDHEAGTAFHDLIGRMRIALVHVNSPVEIERKIDRDRLVVDLQEEHPQPISLRELL